MWKTITAITLILFTVCVSVIFIQWNDHTTHVDASGNISDKVKQEISIKTKEDGLIIEQTISGLSKGTIYDYKIPRLANGLVCSNNGVECEEVKATSIRVNDGTVVFNYELIFNADSEWLVEDWVVELSNTFMTESKVQIVDQYKREGTFIVGSLLQGAVSKDLIEFYVFHGYSNVGSLYWHPEFLKHVRLTASNDLYYKDVNPLEDKDVEILNKYKEAPYVSLVAVGKRDSSQTGILFVNNELNEDELKRSVLYNFYRHNYNVENNWLTDLVISEKLNLPFTTTIAKNISTQLVELMGDSPYHSMINALDKNELAWNPQEIDEYITSKSDYRTYIVSDNLNNVENFKPLELYEKKVVSINDELNYDIRIKVVDDISYFPLTETLTALGYTVQYDNNEKAIFVSQQGENFKLYTENPLFIFNDRRYALKEPALTFIDNKAYLTKDWLKSLFATSSNELGDTIVLFKK